MLLVATSSVSAADPIGKVLFARGAVSAKGADEKLRIVNAGSQLYAGDVLSTGDRSFAAFETTDGSRITVRPSTEFVVEEYAHGGKKEKAVMRLFKGGIRAVTGLISKKNPAKGIRLHASTAVVGIRGTKFDARICEGDCPDSAASSGESAQEESTAVIGRAVKASGGVTAMDTEKKTRGMLEGAPVYKEDVIETSKDGKALVVFRDGSRISVPPNSKFAVESYSFQPKTEEGGAFFRLIRGGMRVLSGIIAKKRPASFKVGAATAVVGVRGTAFDLRLCEGDCDGASDQETKTPAAAKVVGIRGEVTAQSATGMRRVLENGASVAAGDVLETARGGFAVLVFRDNSRVTLQSGTRFAVEDYRYGTGRDGGLVFRLFKGGLRAITGWMAKRNPASFKIKTATAVVGVRGTAIDIFDRSAFSADQLSAMGIDPGSAGDNGGMIFFVREGGPIALTNAAGTFEYSMQQAAFFPTPVASPVGVPRITEAITNNPFPVPENVPADIDTLFSDGAGGSGRQLQVHVREGAVVVTPEGGTAQVVNQGGSAVLIGWSTKAVVVPAVPAGLVDMPVAPPEDTPVDMKSTFGTVSQPTGRAGLYISVYDGHVVLTNESGDIHLGRGEAGFADPAGQALIRLAAPPKFQADDQIPSPEPRQLDNWIRNFESGMGETFEGTGTQENCQCEIVF